MKKAIGYVRVSSEEQSQFGVSLACQREKIEQYAKLYNIENLEVVEDPGISAKNLKRPGMQRILAMMRNKEIETLITVKLDRITRSVRDLIDLVEICNKKDVALVSIQEAIDTGSASGRMVVTLLGALAQMEREQTGERVKAVISYRQGKGEVYSGRFPLYGYQKSDRRLIPCPEEQYIISVVMALKDTYKVPDICRELERRGLRTRNGSLHWHAKVIRKVIKDEAARARIDSSVRIAA